jgi:hypothetical protein
MPTHWTYAELDPASNLEQGDILKPTEELRKLFLEIHPHFSQAKYMGYLVATQSCDLVRRKTTPKASYVNLAVVRPLAQVLPKLIAHVASSVAPGIFATSSKIEARRLLERVVNQNEQSLGLFFLYQDSDSGIGEASVCFLRVTVAFRSEHYEKLLAARTGRVTPEFRAKLGWLLGNLYARPATRDWQDTTEGKAGLYRIIDQSLQEQIPGCGPRWLDDEVLSEARARGIEVAGRKPEELEQFRPKPRHERAIDEIKAEVGKLAIGLSPAQVKDLTSRIDDIKAELSALTLPPSPIQLEGLTSRLDLIKTDLSKPEAGMPDDPLRKLENRLKNSGRFKKLFRAV